MTLKKNDTLRDFIKYVSANIFAMIGISCYILADTFFVSKKLGETGLAALNLSAPTFSIIFALGMMFAVGAGTRFAMHKGAKNDFAANKVFTHTVIIVALISVIFILCGIFFSGQIATMLGADETTFDNSKIYCQMVLCFAPFFMFNNVFQSFVRNDGAPRLAMIATLSGNIFNIVFDYVLVFPCNLDMLGAALATGLAPIVSILILSLHVIRKKNTFKFVKSKVDFRIYGDVCRLGFASFIVELALGVVVMVFNNIFKSLGGDTAVAAYAIVLNIFYVVNAIFNGVASGTQPMISYSYGESDHAKIRQILKYAFITTGVLAVAIYIALFFGADGIARIFNSEGAQQLQELATFGIRLYFISSLFAGFNQMLSCYFAAANKGSHAQVITFIRGIVTVIPLAYLFSHLWQSTGLWLATPVAELITLIIALTIFFVTRDSKTALIPTPAYVCERLQVVSTAESEEEN